MPNRRLPSRLLRTVLVGGFLICVAVLAGCDPPPPEGKRVGNLAPDIVGEDVDGKTLRLSEFRGKVVLVNFWGTWCAPCRTMIPHEREMVENKYRNRPFVMFGIALDSPETLKEFLKTNPLPWPNIVDGNRLLSKQWGADYIPTLILIDHKGVIRQRWEGGASPDEVWADVAKAVTAAEAP